MTDERWEPDLSRPYDPHSIPAGKIDWRVVDQMTWWVDRHSVAHLVAEMADNYRRGVICFLRRFAALAFSWIEPGAGTPESWIETTPLMLELRRLTGTGEPPDMGGHDEPRG